MRIRLAGRIEQLSETMRKTALRRIGYCVGRYESSISLLTIRIDEQDDERVEPETLCTMRANLIPEGTVATSVIDADPESAISRAAERIARIVRERLNQLAT